MKQIIMVSGKGGTGKTSLTAAFAQMAGPIAIADCDVDAANLHLILRADSHRRPSEKFFSGYQAAIHEERCERCGICVSLCRFHAIGETHGRFAVHDLFCEGCGVCADVCPNNAIGLKEKHAGELFTFKTPSGPMIQGRLGIAQSASGKLVTMVRRNAAEIATEDGLEMVLVDGPPGLGCPVIASLSGADAAVIVSEPTVSGVHDMTRILDLCRHFDIPSFLILNKRSLNPELAERQAENGKSRGARFLGSLDFDPLFSKALAANCTLLEYAPESASAGSIRQLWQALISELS